MIQGRATEVKQLAFLFKHHSGQVVARDVKVKGTF